MFLKNIGRSIRMVWKLSWNNTIIGKLGAVASSWLRSAHGERIEVRQATGIPNAAGSGASQVNSSGLGCKRISKPSKRLKCFDLEYFKGRKFNL